MQKLIPTIYFYVLSAVGMALFIIGLFNVFHYAVGITVYDEYPLRYGAESRCEYSQPTTASKEECLKSLEAERKNTKADDLEKSITFTAIGLLVFAVHFYFARHVHVS